MRTTPSLDKETGEGLVGVLALIEAHMTAVPAATRICGADGCLVRVDESCPACLVRFAIPVEQGRFAHNHLLR